MDLQLQQFARDNVMLVPDTMELLTDTELTQYFIQAWSLDYNDKGAYSRGAPCTSSNDFFRCTIQRTKNGDCVQAAPHK